MGYTGLVDIEPLHFVLSAVQLAEAEKFVGTTLDQARRTAMEALRRSRWNDAREGSPVTT